MLDNVITLPVDELNNATLVDEVFNRYDEYQNRTVYISENHTPAMRDLMTLYRTFPKQVGNFLGTRKTSIKFTRDFTVATADGGTTIAPAIVEFSISLPVGVTDAEAVTLRQRSVALIDNDTIMNKFNGLQII